MQPLFLILLLHTYLHSRPEFKYYPVMKYRHFLHHLPYKLFIKRYFRWWNFFTSVLLHDIISALYTWHHFRTWFPTSYPQSQLSPVIISTATTCTSFIHKNALFINRLWTRRHCENDVFNFWHSQTQKRRNFSFHRFLYIAVTHAFTSITALILFHLWQQNNALNVPWHLK